MSCLRVLVLFGLLTAVCAAAAGFLPAHAQTYFVHDDPDYYWYAQDDPAFWLLVPSDATAYRPVELFGAKGVDVLLGQRGPQLEVRRVRSTDVDRIWNAVVAAWGHVLRDSRETTRQNITTSSNVTGRFRVVEGAAADGSRAMIRFVAFTRGEYTVYLTYLGTQASYQGKARDVWLRAVNSFAWR